ncbi:MAG: hypothetical protein E7490_01165 [Ruminococcaceae bacterium]|nr:hypothetical protein [Oscillospiraceae bacterium]
MDNKKEMRLMKVISDIPDDMITSAANEKTKKPWYKNFAVLGTAAACICAVAVGGVLLAMNGQGGYPIKYIYRDADDIKTEENAAYVPKWHERTIEEQYRTLRLSDELYGSRCTQVDSSLVQGKIASATASGYDDYTEKTYTTDVEVYSISKVSEDFAVAVKFAQDDGYYVYEISDYTPDSLESFVSDLNLRENLSFSGKITSKIWLDDGKLRDDVTFEGDVNKAVWDILLSDTDIPITIMDGDEDMLHTMNRGKTMHIGISVKLFGYNNIVMDVDEKGYLSTNILSFAKYFYIGEEKAKEFIDYVEKNFEGYIIKYVYEDNPDDKPKPEYTGESSTLSHDVSKEEVTIYSTARPPHDSGPETTGDGGISIEKETQIVGVGYDTSEYDVPPGNNKE